MRACFYWGDSPMSWLRYMTLHSFRRYNPDWEMVVYTSPINPEKTWPDIEKLDSSDYKGKDWREHLPALGVKVEPWVDENLPLLAPNFMGDMVRWKLLSQGGIFFGMDIIFCAPLTEHHEWCLSQDGAFSCTDAGHFTFGTAGTGRPSKLFQDCYEAALSCGFGKYQTAGVNILYELIYGKGKSWQHTTPDAFKRVQRLYPNLKLYNIPLDWVFPYPTPGECFVENTYWCPGGKPRTIGIHWFGGSVEGQHANNLLTPETLGSYNHPVAQQAREVWSAWKPSSYSSTPDATPGA